jgi:hypothetical protein
MTNVKPKVRAETCTIRAHSDTWAILRSWCPKHYTYSQFLDVIVKERLGDKVKKVAIPDKKGKLKEMPKVH